MLSDEPLTTRRSLYCRQAMPRLWPFSVRTNSHVLVLHTFRGETKEMSLWSSATHLNRNCETETHAERLIGRFQNRVNYWRQVPSCHLDCFGDNGSLTLCLFLQLMELDGACFFLCVFFLNECLQTFSKAILFSTQILKRDVWKRLSIQRPHCLKTFSTALWWCTSGKPLHG